MGRYELKTMSAQSWTVTIETENGGTEYHIVFAPNPHNAQVQLEKRGYRVIAVKECYFWQNVNSSAEFKNL